VSTYVSIGRNVNGEPMAIDRWHAFVAETTTAVERLAGPVVSITEGTGFYEGEREHTAVIVGAADETFGLVDALEALTAAYEQDTIAVTWGKATFVG
jgi:hypothetical protein